MLDHKKRAIVEFTSLRKSRQLAMQSLDGENAIAAHLQRFVRGVRSAPSGYRADAQWAYGFQDNSSLRLHTEI